MRWYIHCKPATVLLVRPDSTARLYFRERGFWNSGCTTWGSEPKKTSPPSTRAISSFGKTGISPKGYWFRSIPALRNCW